MKAEDYEEAKRLIDTYGIGDFYVYFDDDGNLVPDGRKKLTTTRRVNRVKNHPFKAVFVIDRLHPDWKGYVIARKKSTIGETNSEYLIRLRELTNLVTTMDIIDATVKGWWCFSKTGGAPSIRFLETIE